MGSTNKTQYLKLPQWIGTDQPTWLGDMNDAFLKIDEGYDTISGNASTAIAQAGQAVQDAENAVTKANSVETIANQANTNANAALSTANSALETANAANSAITQLENTVDTFTWQSGEATPPNSFYSSFNSIINHSSGLKLLGIAASGTFESAPITIQPTTLLFTLPPWARPATTRTIYSGVTFFNSEGDTITSDLIINPDGTCYKAGANALSMRYVRINLMLATATW